MGEKVIRHKGVTPPPRKRTCAEFLDYWQPRVRRTDAPIELDFSWNDMAITVTDMRIPSALRTDILYTQQEVENGADRVEGDLNARVDKFLTQAVGLK